MLRPTKRQRSRGHGGLGRGGGVLAWAFMCGRSFLKAAGLGPMPSPAPWPQLRVTTPWESRKTRPNARSRAARQPLRTSAASKCGAASPLRPRNRATDGNRYAWTSGASRSWPGPWPLARPVVVRAYRFAPRPRDGPPCLENRPTGTAKPVAHLSARCASQSTRATSGWPSAFKTRPPGSGSARCPMPTPRPKPRLAPPNRRGPNKRAAGRRFPPCPDGAHAARVCERAVALGNVRATRWDAEGANRIDIEAHSSRLWKRWLRTLAGIWRLAVWCGGARHAPTRRWALRGRDVARRHACATCGFPYASERHFWAECPWLEADRAALQREYHIQLGKWRQQPRCMA